MVFMVIWLGLEFGSYVKMFKGYIHTYKIEWVLQNRYN